MQTRFSTAGEAETAFYQAFEKRDVRAMMDVWSHADDIECIHPLGERLMGVSAVSESWRGILSGSRQLRFRIDHAKRLQAQDLAVHIVYETIFIDGRQQPPVIATNVYRFNGSSWHMVLHHASPATGIAKNQAPAEEQAGDTVLH
jgi:ketosteroid isomerase-like protein